MFFKKSDTEQVKETHQTKPIDIGSRVKKVFGDVLSPPKKKRGRPRKATNLSKILKPKRKRGRPRKQRVPSTRDMLVGAGYSLLGATPSTGVRRDIQAMKGSVDTLIGVSGGDPFAPVTSYGRRLDLLIGELVPFNPFVENLNQQIDSNIAGTSRREGAEYAYRIEALISGGGEGLDEIGSSEEYKQRIDKNIGGESDTR